MRKGRDNRYLDWSGQPLINADYNLLTGVGVFTDVKIRLNTPFMYLHDDKQFPLRVPAGVYDGYTIPKWARLLSANTLSPVMPVLICTFVHDVSCKYQLFSKQYRVKIFRQAYDDAVVQFYDGVYPDRRRDKLVRGVFVGSRYLGTC